MACILETCVTVLGVRAPALHMVSWQWQWLAVGQCARLPSSQRSLGCAHFVPGPALLCHLPSNEDQCTVDSILRGRADIHSGGMSSGPSTRFVVPRVLPPPPPHPLSVCRQPCGFLHLLGLSQCENACTCVRVCLVLLHSVSHSAPRRGTSPGCAPGHRGVCGPATACCSCRRPGAGSSVRDPIRHVVPRP
jgi:hypothetical protein